MELVPTRGRPGVTLVMSVARQLTHEDIMRLALEPKAKVGPPVLQKLRASHHRAALELARGKPATEVAALVGRTPQRIRDLMKDPAFQNLMVYYQDQIIETVVDTAQDVNEAWLDITQMTQAAIAERLEDPVQLAMIPIGELRQLATAGSDRTVAPPKQSVPMTSTPSVVTFDIGDKKIIDVTPEEPK